MRPVWQLPAPLPWVLGAWLPEQLDREQRIGPWTKTWMVRRVQQMAGPSGADICGLCVHTNPNPGLVKRRPPYPTVTVTVDLGP